ncbi:MAG TPA: DUF4956 domain-containing protein [Gemmatimonadaceae bacterium]|nr:DUF4956 domain-containing protein [Gemmatimonadaceae bacterium]
MKRSVFDNIGVRLIAYYGALAGLAGLVWVVGTPELRARLAQLWMPGMPTLQVGQALGTPGAVSVGIVAPMQAFFASLAACALALPVAWVYIRTRRAQGFSQSVAHALVLLPTVVAAITVLVKESLPLAFALAGIVAAVRFRNTLEDSKDAVFILLSTAIGLASGVSPAVGSVLSMVFVVLVLALWAVDFAHQPPALEGERAKRQLDRAMAIANRTSQFVARVDREVLESLAPAQLDALAERVRRRRRASGDTGSDSAARYDHRVSVAVSDAEAARPMIESALETYTKRWRFDGMKNGEDEELRAIYSIRLRKGVSPELLSTAIRDAAAPYAAGVNVE